MGCLKLDISKNYEPLLRVVGKNLTTKKMDVNYYSFGSLMPGRNFQDATGYRYGFNQGSEKDDEITGVTGSHYTAEYWEYDSRLGRRWNIDPVVYAYQSSYATFNNNPIYFIDPTGREGVNNGGENDDPVVNPNNPIQGEEFTVTEKKGFWRGIGDFFKSIWNYKGHGSPVWGDGGSEAIGDGKLNGHPATDVPLTPISTGSISGGLKGFLELTGGILSVADKVEKEIVIPFRNPNNRTKTTAADVQAKTQEVNSQAHGNVEGKIEGVQNGAERQFKLDIPKNPDSVTVIDYSKKVGAHNLPVYDGSIDTTTQYNSFGSKKDTVNLIK